MVTALLHALSCTSLSRPQQLESHASRLMSTNLYLLIIAEFGSRYTDHTN